MPLKSNYCVTLSSIELQKSPIALAMSGPEIVFVSMKEKVKCRLLTFEEIYDSHVA